jgi:predicted kinase
VTNGMPGCEPLPPCPGTVLHRAGDIYAAARIFAGITFDDLEYPGYYAVSGPARYLAPDQFIALAQQLRQLANVSVTAPDTLRLEHVYEDSSYPAMELMRSCKAAFEETDISPALIIVTGRPASGKTILANWLAKELQVPVVSKDSVREVLFERLGWKDRPWAQLLGRDSIDLMFSFAQAQLEAGRSLILDNSFDPALSTPRFRALIARYHPRTIQIVCNADVETLFERFRSRAASGKRHPGHGDEAVFDRLRAHLAQGQSPVLDIGGVVLEVDTTDLTQVDSQGLLRQVKSFHRRGRDEGC